MNDRVEISVEGGVADVRLVRADKMNAIDQRMFDAITEAGEVLRGDARVRAVVLSGQGRAFCAGLDRASFAAMIEAGSTAAMPAVASNLSQRTHGIANQPQHAAFLWRELRVPVIAALHGVVFGGGFQICLGADIRFAAPDTRLSIMEIRWGLVPDMGGTQLMQHLARDDVIRALTYSGRIFSAGEAMEYGFVTRVVDDPRAQALQLASEIAGRNPDAIGAAKRLFNAAAYLSAEEGLLMESAEQERLIGSPNQREAVLAELEQRSARFT